MSRHPSFPTYHRSFADHDYFSGAFYPRSYHDHHGTRRPPRSDFHPVAAPPRYPRSLAHDELYANPSLLLTQYGQMLTKNGAVVAAAIVSHDRRQAGTTLATLAAVLGPRANSQGITITLSIGTLSVAVADAEGSNSTTLKIRCAIVRTTLGVINRVCLGIEDGMTEKHLAAFKTVP